MILILKKIKSKGESMNKMKVGNPARGNKYMTVKLPHGLISKIDKMIEESNHDYTSRTDVIKTAVRLLYRDSR